MAESLEMLGESAMRESHRTPAIREVWLARRSVILSAVGLVGVAALTACQGPMLSREDKYQDEKYKVKRSPGGGPPHVGPF